MKNLNQIKENEQSVLATFKKEIPSVYYSDKSKQDFENYKKNSEYLFRYLFKFPPEMFKDKNLIDFGAGTGENTVYLANWGAKCTLVEMNEDAQSISKEVFKKYTANFENHKFIHSSIFDFDFPELYQTFDIVHCRGVLSHTADKERAFDTIAKYLKPGGYLIFGDPNKAGGFQNMLQRLLVYNYAKDWTSMIRVCEELFSEDINRSQKYINRTRNTIIFDRWVVQCQDDPSVEEVLKWFKKNDLNFYSSYPNFTLPFLSDSLHHKPKFSFSDLDNFAGIISESIWMLYDNEDAVEIPKMLSSLDKFSKNLNNLVSYVSKSSLKSKINSSHLNSKIDEYLDSLDQVDMTDYIRTKSRILLNETKELFKLIEQNDYNSTKKFLKKTKILFKGAVGVRHLDFIGHKILK